MNARALDQKRYFRSRGIDLPEVTTVRLKCTSMLGAVQSAFSIVAQYGYEGLQSWYNIGLGVVWLSTAPNKSLVVECPF
jgi:hypothetical protein